MVTMGCRAMEPMKSLDQREISAHGQARTVRMIRISCFVSPGGPEGAREGIQASGEETSGHGRSRMKTKKEMFAEVGRVFCGARPMARPLPGRTVQ